ncbi:DUF4395 domain-containing protein [Mucilaginibacter terrigena]|uniref:DUF4395 domain-containing protein n=1 Tax=Mucilaginibacter terrigena TaxID=2492395 RepID=A0A4Q5LR30_9SPHI|nr:DUF4395 domain-containing protein [Mucilaginibacter terrigena]RYU91894.1 DUF4395 domain-containing protein [Mucilaginibacter terrigena]
MSSHLQCPVDNVKVNENKVRMIALLVLLLGTLFLTTGYDLVILLLLFDFFTRAFNHQKYSPLGWVADVLIRRLNVPYKPTNRAPKRFAAGMGFVFVMLILFAMFLNWNIVSVALTAGLCLFAFLESFAGFCMGCYIYTGLHKLLRLFRKA